MATWGNLLRLIIGSAGKKSAPRRPALPDRITRLQNGFWWHSPPSLALAAGRGFNQEVAGESHRQDAISHFVGGKSLYGCNVYATAELVLPNDMPDHPDAVGVMIDAKLVGFIPTGDSAAVKAELLSLTGTDNGVTCKAAITHGWDDRANGGTEGSFRVVLSLARPLRARTK